MSTDSERAPADEASETDESRLRRFDKRIEEWLTSLKDEASERSPEVLTAMAAKAKDAADYLERMAEQARARRMPPRAALESSPSDVVPGSAAERERHDAEDQDT